jgi:hypothetical protein
MHPLQLLLQSLKQVVQIKESETLSTSNSSLCQSVRIYCTPSPLRYALTIKTQLEVELLCSVV